MVTCHPLSVAKAIAMAGSREDVRAHRARLRAQGLKPVQIWVPDTASKVFEAAALQQSAAVAASAGEAADQAWIEAVAGSWPEA
ncbi:MAG: hypothetical protein RL026_1452 [Pseudomonadota bacterium]